MPDRKSVKKGKSHSAFRSLGSVHDTFREGQQARADLQTGTVSGQEIHLELQSVVFDGKADNPPGRQKIGCFSHGQDAGTGQALQKLRVSPHFRAANEDNLAIAKFRILVHPTNFHAPAMWRRATSQLSERCPKGKISTHANGKGRLLRQKCSVRPVNEAGERGQKLRFASVFRWNGLLRAQGQHHASGEASHYREAQRDWCAAARCAPCQCDSPMEGARHNSAF